MWKYKIACLTRINITYDMHNVINLHNNNV